METDHEKTIARLQAERDAAREAYKNNLQRVLKAEAERDDLLKSVTLLLRVIGQAKLAISAVGHRVASSEHPGCNFSGCTCGAVENFKIESGEFWRLVQELAAPKKAGTK